jgi:Zn-dependent M16 (insulinase) family peptidase
MNKTYDFKLLREQEIRECNIKAELFRHRTGAELLSLQNDDENKAFGIAFAMPLPNSTGVAHILEHSVLCGSRKYPLKKPFIELVKGSLKTYLGARSYKLETTFTVASANRQDFYNLIDVYLDAVFYPKLAPHTFAQEGWRYELENPDDPLIFKGVVFNEVKGYFASPDYRLFDCARQSLFPDTPYRFNSDGRPEHIPELTYEELKRFHEIYYHPSNARIAFYGDDDPIDRLRLMNEWLKEFEPRVIDSQAPPQPRFAEPRRFVYPYPVSAGSPNANNGHVMVSWALDKTEDAQEVMALGILIDILTSTPASPVRKALIDSGLGEEVIGRLDIDHQISCHIGFKGIAAKHTGAVESLILETLREQVRKGIDTQTVAAVINATEFATRELSEEWIPRGLALMFNASRRWVYDGDPFASLAFEAPLAAIRARLDSGERYFEELIARRLLDNTHRATVTLQPDKEMGEREAEREMTRLAQARAAMSPEEIQTIIKNTREFKRLQDTPDPPEALATIPTLRLSDLGKVNKTVPCEVLRRDGVDILYHTLPTNGVVYFDVGFNLRLLPQELLRYAPLFGRALTQVGTEQEDFVRLAQRIWGKTGGVKHEAISSGVRDSHASSSWLFLRAKALRRQVSDALEILGDVLLRSRLDDRERFRQIALEEKAGVEARLSSYGAGFAHTRLHAHWRESGWVGEQISGVTYLFFLRQLIQAIDREWPRVLADLEKIRRLLLNRRAMICNVTLDEDCRRDFDSQVGEFLASLPTAPPALTQWAPPPSPVHEGMTMPSQVNAVGKSVNLHDLGYRPRGSSKVISNYLRTTWMWERVRTKGGAYGVHITWDDLSGVWSFLSSQVPNILETLDLYDTASQFLRELKLSEAEVSRSIIGVIGNMDSPQLPNAKGWTSMRRFLEGETEESRQAIRDEILSTTAADFNAFADTLEAFREKGRVVILGSPEAIDAVNQKRSNWLRVFPVM